MSTQDPNVATDDGDDDDDGDDVTTTAPTAATTSLLTVPTASASVSIPGASVGTVGITVLPGGSTTTVTLATATGGAAVTRTVTGITAPTATNGTSNGTSTDSGSGGGGLSQSAKIAIGVSVPLGILLLLLLTLGAYRMGSRGRHGGSVLGGLFGRRSASGAAASGSPKALVPSAANDDDDAEKAMLAEKNATQPRGPVELATGPDVPELPTAVNYQELAAGDPWEAKRALEAQQVGGGRGADADDDQIPRSREMLGGAGVLAGGGAARQVNYGVNMNRKPVAGAGSAVRREGSQASSSYGAAHSPVSPARTASQSHHSSSEPMSSISPMSSNSPMMPVELPGDTGMRRENG
ncbi:hypothetical protein SLS56_006181 [Neofusicoccum ribis]|uniref:Uncharacterized protein n=1 Tax=Neofusicoccum ribis TaxID=45134 RepID=A0ABR3SRG8_9PEZI